MKRNILMLAAVALLLTSCLGRKTHKEDSGSPQGFDSDYWSSTYGNEDDAWNLDSGDGDADMNYGIRYGGRSEHLVIK
ncbi:MAG: hypothetical protein IJL38_01255 [Bacteroidales bacterium]|nr:hypothetical protein [Bacteroidales bacterium]